MITAMNPESKNAEAWEHSETNLIRYRPNGKYYVKAKIRGRKVRECLGTLAAGVNNSPVIASSAREPARSQSGLMKVGTQQGPVTLTTITFVFGPCAWVGVQVTATAG